MRRTTFPILLAVLFGCNKPEGETTPPSDGTTPETTPTEPAEPAEPATDPEAERKAAEEAAAKEAADKKAAADAQIAKGKELFGANCASCHGDNGEGKKGKAPAVVGEGALPLDPPKKAKMRKGIKFSTAADVADFVVKNMPPKKGGSLQPEEYYAILGFDLSANGVELKEPLSAENAASIVIHPAEPAADAAAAPAATPPAK